MAKDADGTMDADITDATANARWARENTDVVWCDRAEGVLQAVQDRIYAVEIGACSDLAAVLDAVEKSAEELEYLSFVGCGLDAESLARLGDILSETGIMGIGISNNGGIEPEDWTGFWEKLPSTVHKLDFGDNRLNDETLPELAAVLLRMKEVTELFLDGNEFTQLRPLVPLVEGSSCLVELDLGDNSIGDAEVICLAGALPGSTLTTLVLGRNPISDAGAMPVVEALPQTKIETLHFDSTRIGDATVDSLTQLLLTTSLEELHIDQTQVRDDAILRLIAVLPESRLKLFDCGENNLKEETIEAIEAALPDTMIE